MENGFLDQFVLPEGAAEKIKAAGITSQRLGEGIEMLHFGHDKGVAYRFFVTQVKNEAKSKIAKVSIPDSIEMIEWQPDRFQKPTERLRFLPSELLEFDEDGVCIGGLYKPTYDAWKKGLTAPGLSLSKWGVLSDSEVFTLHDMKIFSVEQFAAQPRSKIDRLPSEFIAAFEEAIEYSNGKAGREATAQMASEVLALRQEGTKRDAEMEELRALVAKLSGGAPKAKAKKKPSKVRVENGEIKEDN